MKKVNIRCPKCAKRGYLAVEENIVSKSERGITAVNVGEFLICNHSFVAYIDKNFDVRDTFTTDFTIELPQIEIEKTEDLPKEEEEGYRKIDMYMLLINVKVVELAYILKALLLKKKVLYINDLDLVQKQLSILLKMVFSTSFDYDFSIVSSLEYKKNKKQYKNHIVIDNKKVINDKYKLLDSNKIKVVSKIIEKFLSESHQESSIIILKNEMWKAFTICNEIQTILGAYKGENILGKKELLEMLNEKYHIKIQFNYLEFLLEILKEYFDYDLSKLSDYYLKELGI